MELSLAKPFPRKPLLLKDYLLDDLSSCSSNGFRSYPRRQCCTKVRFLLEIDLKTKPQTYKKKPFLKNPSKSASSTTISAFQRASEAVINVVKHLPFVSLKSPASSSRLKLAILPRSLSWKLRKRSFWKRTDHRDIQRWKPIEHLIQEQSTPPDITITAGDSNSSTSESNRKSNSWSGSDFTASEDSQRLSANSEVKNPNKIRHSVVMENNKNRLPSDKAVSNNRIGVIVGGDDSMDAIPCSNTSTFSTTNTKWPNEEEKEQQFSPVSVLDCPFDDEDDEVSSPFQHRFARMEETKKRLMKKIQRFERLTHLEPVNLEKRIAVSESDQESNGSPQHYSSESIQEDFALDMEEEENQADETAQKLLQLIKDTTPLLSLKSNLDTLLLDFFKQGLENCIGHTNSAMLDNELLNIANDWLKGQPRKVLVEWEVQMNREAYIRDMERGGKWRKVDVEKQEMAVELEADIFASLVNELFHDILQS